jgi:hypothetical protein
MSTPTEARPRLAAAPLAPLRALARIEAGRVLRHPAPWIGILLWAASNAFTLMSPPRWSTAQYSELTYSMTYLALGVSVATAYAFGRERANLCEEAPMPAERRAAARLLGCLSLAGLVAVAVAAGALWLRLAGGVALGVEPGRTLHAHFTLAELLQPVALTAFAVALAAAVVHMVRHPLAASILLFVMWFIAGPAYWVVNGPVLRWFAPVLVQPLELDVAPPSTDPLTLPTGWLLQPPGEFQPYWARIVVVPELAAWHALYLLGLALLAAAVAIPGYRRRLAALGAVVAGVAVLLQASVTP